VLPASAVETGGPIGSVRVEERAGQDERNPVKEPRVMATRNETSELTVIGRDTKIKGEMHFEAGARILGEFEGRITSSGEVQIGESAQCSAEIEADSLVVDGVIEGNAVVQGQLSLNETAVVKGDLRSGTMVVADGATFVGNCAIGPRAGELTGDNAAGRATGSAEAKPAARRARSLTEDELTPPWKREGSASGSNESVSAATTAAAASKSPS